MTQLPLISILTPSYNQGRYIQQTIISVLAQKYPRLEHIVIDGGSTDDTVSILKRYPHLKWISEKDRGQADSLNKGLAIATGSIVGWVNSDDFYAPGVFSRISEIFEDPDVQWLVGDVANYYQATASEQYIVSQPATYESLIRDPDILRQQGGFFRADLLRRIGGWDPDLYMVMDLDLWLRMARVQPPYMLHEKIAYFRVHPDQKTGLARGGVQACEIDRVLRRYGVSPAIRFRQRAKKRVWWLKGLVKGRLERAGVLNFSSM
jgi:glycosyltransferase involved in cell wall biosynthesis